MALMPKRVKHRKTQRGHLRGNATRGNRVAFGEYGIQATEHGWVNARQIEAGRIACNQYLAHEGRIWIRIFPDKPVSSTPAETRMGKGKGEPNMWVACVRPGTILFEVGGVPELSAKTGLARTAMKMPVKCRFVKRRIA